jgi:hypothetical protein
MPSVLDCVICTSCDSAIERGALEEVKLERLLDMVG